MQISALCAETHGPWHVTSPDPFGKEATLPQQRLLNRDEGFNDTLTTPAIRRKVGILLRALFQDVNSRREAVHDDDLLRRPCRRSCTLRQLVTDIVSLSWYVFEFVGPEKLQLCMDSFEVLTQDVVSYLVIASKVPDDQFRIALDLERAKSFVIRTLQP